MSKKEKRVINAFINCVKNGEFSYDYAVTLIEDTDKYGYLTDEAKETFYAEFENAPSTEATEEPIVEETETEPTVEG